MFLGWSNNSSNQIGEKAEVRIQIGKRVFWNVEKVKTYIDLNFWIAKEAGEISLASFLGKNQKLFTFLFTMEEK